MADTITHDDETVAPEAKSAIVEGPPIIIATATAEPAEDTAIRPFEFHASDEDLADLRRRIAATRWPDKETVTDDSQGVQLATMQKLASYWATDYDWRKVEAKLNSSPQFITNIDGLDIHFIHVRSAHPNALPLIIRTGARTRPPIRRWWTSRPAWRVPRSRLDVPCVPPRRRPRPARTR